MGSVLEDVEDSQHFDLFLAQLDPLFCVVDNVEAILVQ